MAARSSYRTFPTFSQFSGTAPVDLRLFEEEVARQDLASSLAFIAAVSMELAQLEKIGMESDSLQYQCHYLLQALADDFPVDLQGRLKRIGGRLLLPVAERCHFVHPHGLAYLSHMLLLHAQGEQVTAFPDEIARRRLLRLLLIANDYLGLESHLQSLAVQNPLHRQRAVSLEILRTSQFSQSDSFYPVMEDFARQYLLFTEHLPQHFPGFLERFQNAAGVSIQDYFAALFMMAAHFRFEAAPDRQVGTRDGLMSNIEGGTEVVAALIDRWTRTPADYRAEHAKWTKDRPSSDDSLDLVLLKEKPLIALEGGVLVCPHPPFLFNKVLDEPYFVFERTLTESDAGRFGDAIGAAYEDYADSLIARIAKSDKGGPWHVVGKVTSSRQPGNEWEVDNYIQRGTVAVAFEHKAVRPSTKFLRGSDDGSVLGPAPEVSNLQALNDQDQTRRLTELAAFGKKDKGLLTRGLWRLSHAQSDLPARASLSSNLPLATKIIPVLTRQSSLIVPEEVAAGYLGRLVEAAGLFSNPCWSMPPQWIDVRSLEFLARIAETGHLDLEEFLRAKAADSPYGRFDEAALNLASELGLSPHDPKLATVWSGLAGLTERRFFAESEASERLAKLEAERQS